MIDDTRRPRPVLNSIAPHLYVADVAASCRYYVEMLGFNHDFTYGEPAFYAQLSRDEARFAVRFVGERVFAADVREREHLLSASITVATADEIDALYATYRDAGVRFHQRLETQPWGARDFVIADPDGNLILFAGPDA
jgi:uncharacterized glyoxalase superfamily protein PhnB